ncbi:hypothetical protein ACHQM5_007906 [Ranunculus cassubicifolius]
MTKFNVLQKKRRAQLAESKREIHGDPYTRKLKVKPQTVVLSGKRKRKLARKSRREQKEAIKDGVISMEDIEMAVSQGNSSKGTTKFHMKRSPKINIKQQKRGGKKQKGSSGGDAKAQVDSMVE